MAATGQKRRLRQWAAAPRLPLYAVSDQTRAALQYVAMGHFQKLDGLFHDSGRSKPNALRLRPYLRGSS